MMNKVVSKDFVFVYAYPQKGDGALQYVMQVMGARTRPGDGRELP